jgi:hypothetical protein
MEAFVVERGAHAYGHYPDIDELFPRQAVELDRWPAIRGPRRTKI